MKFQTIAGGVLAALIAVSGSAYAASTTYVLGNHPDAANNPPFDYGLRVDDIGTHFTFVNGGATLTYDDMALTAVIEGTINVSLGTTNDDSDIGTEINLFYELSGITSDGNGGFNASGGSGSISDDGAIYFFEGKQKAGTNVAATFAFDGHRLAGDNSSPVFRGWIMDAFPELFLLSGLYDNYYYGPCGLPLLSYDGGGQQECLNDGYTFGTNDFLVTATPIPLPAGVWLLGTALAGLGLMRRRKGEIV